MARQARIALLSGVAAAALLLPETVWAQTPLNPIVVEGANQVAPAATDEGAPTTTESATGPVNGYVAKTTATGSKTATPITEIPQSVSVIGRQELEDRGVTKVDEALRYTPGVFAQPFGNDNDTNWIYIRGFDATQTGVFQDGLQLFSFAFGGNYTDSFSLERIEVLRGASSVLYGGSNPGGLVNLVTKHPDGERLRYLESGINDAGDAWLGFDIGDKASPAIDYRITGRIGGGDGYTDFEDEFRGFIAPAVTFHVDRDTDFTVLANYTFLDETHGGGGFLPYIGTVVDAPFGKISPERNFTEPGIDEYQRRQASIGYEFEHRFSPDWAVRQNLRYGYSDLHEVAPFTFGYTNLDENGLPKDALLNRFDFEHRSTVNSFLVDNQAEGRVQTGPIEHRLLLGSDYKWWRLDQLQLSGFGTPIDAVNPVYGAPQPPFTFITDQVVTLEQLGFYAQDQLRFGDGWIATLGGRYDHVDMQAKGTGAFDTSDDQWSGRAGLAYEFKNGLTPYASVSTFFNPQIANAGQGFVEPETGQQYEVGVKYAPKWFDGIITAALFDLTKQNVLTGAFPNQALVGEVNSQGIELEAKANLTKDLRLTAFFTAFDLEITKDASRDLVGNTPFLVPELQTGIALDYTFHDGALQGVSLGGGIRYQGESWADNDNTRKVPDVALFDAKIGYAKDNWGIDLNVLNLFDEEYVSGCQGLTTCSYGEGRVVKLKTHITW
ncbi:MULTISPECIES: TonB-dependent siderophore receptor [Rhodomicrobium]|uniref:TonB-dependent siderophore receptor n=1 Tax=Rhodomicrobium sp. R_RK_3 TaxID=2029567 RepID=UPI000B4BD27C|nr:MULTISPECIES: TonB-dependent siderophore receptor [Rhodomicrobium]